MVWNEGEEYKISFFHRVVSKDVELSRNFPEYVSVGYKEIYIYVTQMLQNKTPAIRMTSSVS